MKWIDINDEQPRQGRNIIAVGVRDGEISGQGESGYMGIGTWRGTYVAIDSDTYATNIIHVTHWMPLPEYP